MSPLLATLMVNALEQHWNPDFSYCWVDQTLGGRACFV